MAPWTKHSILVAGTRLPFEKCAPALDKLLAFRVGDYFVFQCGNLFVKTGVFLLKLGYMFFERRRLFEDQRKALLHDRRRCVFGDEAFNVGEDAHVLLPNAKVKPHGQAAR